MCELIDSHVHLDDPRFDADREAVIARARESGVTTQIVPAVAADGWAALRALCRAGSGLHAAYGLHPLFLDRHRPQHLDELRAWLRRERPVAVGECGLDFHADGLDRERQRWYFRGQLELAREFGLPVIIHARQAVEEVILALRDIGPLRGVVHSYGGSEQQARRLVALGFALGIGGPVTYERARRLRRVVAAMPLEALLLETDAPDQPCAGHRGERNEPARLSGILRCVATLRGESEQMVAAATTRNARRLFALPA
ncbi:MAG TPA: TatD family hydrolase [Rhodanobacteraceae bacterium]|nr:TatD family hydrolase [Rhodanobacteraceae bacterium]